MRRIDLECRGINKNGIERCGDDDDDAGAGDRDVVMPPPGGRSAVEGVQGEAKLSLIEGGAIILRRRVLVVAVVVVVRRRKRKRRGGGERKMRKGEREGKGIQRRVDFAFCGNLVEKVGLALLARHEAARR